MSNFEQEVGTLTLQCQFAFSAEFFQGLAEHLNKKLSNELVDLSQKAAVLTDNVKEITTAFPDITFDFTFCIFYCGSEVIEDNEPDPDTHEAAKKQKKSEPPRDCGNC